MKNEISVFCVFDTKSGVYDVPFFALNSVLARRRFILDCRSRQEDTVLSGFKDDYELHEVGRFDQGTANFITNGYPTCVIKGTEVKFNEE